MDSFTPTLRPSFEDPFVGVSDGAVSFDSDAQTYIDFIEGDGVSLSGSQKSAINSFYVTGKSNGWYSKLKRVYLPIWEAASPNSRCLVSSTSGTFQGSFNYDPGYSYSTAASNANRFNTGYKLLDGLTIEDGCLMALAYDDTPPTNSGINAVNKTIIGSGAWTVDSVRINTGNSSTKLKAVWLGVDELTLPTSSSHGVLLSNRKDGATSLSRRDGSVFHDDSTTGALTGTYNNNFPITGFGSASSRYLYATQATTSKAGALGISEGLDSAERSSYTLAIKNLWETCSGLTL